jgi:two-component system, cell cycle sensor histidine kinase and response regulator CckA
MGEKEEPRTVVSSVTQDASWLWTLVDSMGTAVLFSSAAGQVQFLNKAAEKLLDLRAEDAFGQPLPSVLRLETKDGSPIHGDLARLAILNGSGMTLGRDLVVCGAHGRRDVEGEIAPFECPGSMQGVVITLRDVTSQNRDEDRAHKTQTLQAVAHLAGSIAHDLNNALTLILGYSDVLLGDMPDGSPSRAATEQIRSAGEAASKVCKQLQMLSRRRLLLSKPVNISALIEQEVLKLQSIAGLTGLGISTELASMGSEVQADPDQILEMIRNFVQHGKQLLPEGGEVVFKAAVVELTPDERGARTHRYVRMLITYSGEGIKFEDNDSLFEPRFQQTGGLDLFLIAAMVSELNGHISVHNRRGASTTFEVQLPCIEDPHPLFSNERNTDEQRKPTILLVEDDDDIRSLVCMYLTSRNYHLLEARDGEEALLTSEFYDGLIDVLITDVAMPRMSGPQLVQVLASKRPEMKVLLISGYSTDLPVMANLPCRGIQLLPKPFRIDDLLLRVQEMLSNSSTTVN